MRHLLLVALLLVATSAHASFYTSSASADGFDCGSDSAFDDKTAWTSIAWVYNDNLTSGNQYILKGANAFILAIGTSSSFRGQRIRTTSSLTRTATSVLSVNVWQFLVTRYTNGRTGTCTTSDITGCDIQTLRGTLTTQVAIVGGTYSVADKGSGGETTDASAVLSFGGNLSNTGSSAYIARAMFIAKDLSDSELQMLQFAPIGVWNSFPEAHMLIEPYGTGNTPDRSGAGRGPSSGSCTASCPSCLVGPHLPVQ